RIAKQLGVDVPPNIPSRGHMEVREEAAPKTDAGPVPFTVQELFAPLTRPGPISSDDLTGDDVSTLEALRVSMEKGALVLRSLAHCETLGSFPGCGLRPSTKYGFGRKRTSNTRSLASGIPLRKPKLSRVRLSLSSRPGPPNFAVMASRSS